MTAAITVVHTHCLKQHIMPCLACFTLHVFAAALILTGYWIRTVTRKQSAKLKQKNVRMLIYGME